jgi:very-short-patch-repair endonuclease
MTEAEQLQGLRGKHLDGFRFRKPHPIERFVRDFYCPSVRLAIEIEGAQHSTVPGCANDDERTRCLNALGIRVLRVWNHAVLQYPQGVVQRVWAAVHLPPPPV